LDGTEIECQFTHAKLVYGTDACLHFSRRWPLPDLKQTRSKRINDVFFTAKASEQAAKDDGQAMQFSANSVK
jgi:hypothetical protein